MIDFKENLHVFTKEFIENIEKTYNRSKQKWTLVWISQMLNKCLKISWGSYQNDYSRKGRGGTINMWFLKQKILGLVFD